MRTLIPRVLALFLVVAGLQATAVADPAWACGCGAAYLSSGSVSGEQSVIRFDGHTETISLQLRLRDARGGRAALVLPVPGAAQVSLGSPQLIPALSALTIPQTVVRHYLFADPDGGGGVGAAAAPNPGVSVLSEQRLGAFDVAQLGATNVAALGGWLSADGFTLSPGVAKGLSAYVAQGWRYVAVKLDVAAATDGSAGAGPGADPGTGTGTGAATDASGGASGAATGLDPIDVAFATSELVYPMRLSVNAADPQSVTLYILAPHEMQVATDPVADTAGELEYAGWVNAGQVSEPPLNGSGRMFLTVYAQSFPEPGLITNDFTFVQASQDLLQVPAPVVVWEPEYWLGLRPAVVLAAAGLALVLLVLGFALARRRTTAGRGRGR